MKKPTSMQTRSSSLQQQIFMEDFYAEKFNACLKRLEMTVEGIKEFKYSDRTLNTLWNEFWFVLPDSAEIRTETFFFLCDLAEEIEE